MRESGPSARPLRVLYVAHGVPPYDVGGTERFTYDLAQVVAERAEVHLVVPRTDPGQPSSYRTGRIRVHVLETAAAPLLADGFYCRDHGRRFRTLLGRLRPDVAHVQHLATLSATVLEELASARVPFFVHLHDYWLVCPRVQLRRADATHCSSGPRGGVECLDCHAADPEVADVAIRTRAPRWLARPGLARAVGRWTDRLERLAPGTVGRLPERPWLNAVALLQRPALLRSLLLRAELLFAPSDDVRRRFVSEGIPADRVVHLEEGVGFRPRAVRVEAPHLRLAFIGNAGPHKGGELLVRAFARCSAPETTLSLYGGGDLSPLARLGASLGCDRLHVGGRLDRDGLDRTLASSDALVVPSTWPETFCIVAREALLAGVPVLGARIGALPELIRHGDNGLLFAPGDVEALHAALQRFATDASLRRHLRRQAGSERQRRAIKTLEVQGDELLGYYRRALSGRRRAALA